MPTPSHSITKVIQHCLLTFALQEFSSVMQRRVATASPKHRLRSTSAHTFAAVARQCKHCPCCQQRQRSETDVLLTVSLITHTLCSNCDALLPLHPSVAPPHPRLSPSLSLSRSLLLYLSLPLSLTAAVLQCCSLL